MGLFSGKSRSGIGSQGQSLVDDAKALADRDKAEFEALRKQQSEDAQALKKRSKSMQGGGRAGLMYGGNAQGVM